jgi:hypothetical protein
VTERGIRVSRQLAIARRTGFCIRMTTPRRN